MNFLIIADPLEKLSPAADTSLYLSRRAMERGHAVHWSAIDGIRLDGSRLAFSAKPLVGWRPDGMPETGSMTSLAETAIDSVWIRKDPPFDRDYLRLCWLLSLAEGRIWMMNRPSRLSRYHEKLLPLEAVACGYLEDAEVIPTYFRPSDLDSIGPGDEEIVAKPFFGHGGSDVRRLNRKAARALDPNETLLQPFIPDVATDGDRRIFYLGGRYLGQVARMPKDGGFVSNFAQGGRAENRPLSSAQRAVVGKLGKFLDTAGIALAGADLIGTRISEVNITSPTGLVIMEKMTKTDFGGEVIDFVESQVRSFSQEQ